MFPGSQGTGHKEQEGREAYPGGTFRTGYHLERAQNNPVSLRAAEVLVSHPSRMGLRLLDSVNLNSLACSKLGRRLVSLGLIRSI